MGRPKDYTTATKVKLAPDGTSRLQCGSDRRAVVTFVLNQGGVADIASINEDFGFDMTTTVKALVHTGWLEVVS